MVPNDNRSVLVDRASVGDPLTEAEAAVRLGLKIATLRAWRHRGMGPPFVRLGRAVRYLPADIEAFLAANRHSPPRSGESPV